MHGSDGYACSQRCLASCSDQQRPCCLDMRVRLTVVEAKKSISDTAHIEGTDTAGLIIFGGREAS